MDKSAEKEEEGENKEDGGGEKEERLLTLSKTFSSPEIPALARPL